MDFFQSSVWFSTLRWSIASSLSLLSLLTHSRVLSQALSVPEADNDRSQVTAVSQLSDVQPTDWAFQALQSLVERYGCIVGDPNQTFRGNQALTRYEFAAGLNACLDRINELLAANTSSFIRREDLDQLQRLQEEFAAELATLGGRIESLEVRTATLETTQFSTTTKLRGQVIFAATAGGFRGDRIVDPTNTVISRKQPNATFIYRAALDLNTSFRGTDSLRVLLDIGSDSGTDNTAGLLEPNFGSVLDFSIKPPVSTFGISRAYYTFKPTADLSVSIGANMRLTDYIDTNSYANLSFRDFSTQAFVNNLILFPLFGPVAGAAINWNPGDSAFSLRAVYGAGNPENPGRQGIVTAVTPFVTLLYPGATPTATNLGDRGLFGDTFQGSVEAEYAPSKTFALRLQYSGGEVFNNRFDVFGINAELALSPRFALFGRYGYGSYSNTTFGDINPSYWMAGIALPDLFSKGTLAGIAVGQPFITNDTGNGTQTNFEAFYNLPLNDNIQLTPVVQVILNPSNQDSNGTIITGTVRTVFSF